MSLRSCSLPSPISTRLPHQVSPPDPNSPGRHSAGALHGHLGSLLPPRGSNLLFAERCHQRLQETVSSSSLSRFRNLSPCCFFFFPFFLNLRDFFFLLFFFSQWLRQACCLETGELFQFELFSPDFLSLFHSYHQAPNLPPTKQ